MKISLITLFPQVFDPILNTSILKRAQKKGAVEFEFINLRDFGEGKHQLVDDRPYGGGAGMVLRADILAKALQNAIDNSPLAISSDKPYVILTSASGKPYKQKTAQRFSKLNHLIIVCGHYEGIDQRFIENYVDEEISIGDYVLTGGEIPAMVIIDSIVRLISGVLKKPEAIAEESFSTNNELPASPAARFDSSKTRRERGERTTNLLEYPHYTRPEEFEGKKVPAVLLSGNHQKIATWRSEQSLKKTKKERPDLLIHNK